MLQPSDILTPDQLAQMLQVTRGWITSKTRRSCDNPLPHFESESTSASQDLPCWIGLKVRLCLLRSASVRSANFLLPAACERADAEAVQISLR